MKIIFYLFTAVLFFVSCKPTANVLKFTEPQSILVFLGLEGENELKSPCGEEPVNVIVANTSKGDISVKVLKTENNEEVRGFGLNQRATEIVFVDKGEKLIIETKNEAKVKLGFEEYVKPIENLNKDIYVNFTLQNTSAKSIPIIIPTVMNPNLSPFSNSGVGLKYSQEVFLNKKGKKEKILTVGPQIKEGDVIDVAKLIKDY
jgi:hypothetical protein